MMHLLSRVSTLVLCVLLATTHQSRGFEVPKDLETDKNEDLLVGEFKIGATYVASVIMDQTTTIEMAGTKQNQTMNFVKDEETVVSEAPDGLMKLEITPTRLSMSMDMMGQTVSFDSASESNEENPMFLPLKDLLGHTTEILVDEDGNIVHASEHEEYIKQVHSGGVDTMKQFSSNQSLDQRNRMLSMLPKQPVKPGDTWHFDADMGDMMHSAGIGALKGYTNYKGHSCAVIALQGSFEFNVKKFADAMAADEDMTGGKELAEATEGTEIKDGKQTIFILWDNEAKFARSAWMKQTMTMQMPNPLGDGVLEIPTVQLMKVSVDMTE